MNKVDSYEKLFIRFYEFVERWIKKMVIGLAILVIISQILLQSSDFRDKFTRVDSLEGRPFCNTFHPVVYL